MKTQYLCSSCGAEAFFKSRRTSYLACTYCQTLLCRTDTELSGLSAHGRIANLVESHSILQIGTRGSWRGKAFEVIGQLVTTWAAGEWYEWYLLHGDGEEAWIGEACGRYSYTKVCALPEEPSWAMRSGDWISLNGQRYQVSDVKEVTYARFEGELPFELHPGEKGLSIDLLSETKACAFLEKREKTTLCYTGFYADFDELALSNIRAVDGW